MPKAIKDPSTGLYTVDADGHRFEFSKYGARDSMRVAANIISLGGRSLAVVLAAAGIDGEMPDLDAQLVGDLLSQVTSDIGIKRDLAIATIEELCTKGVFIDGKQPNFDLFFAENAQLMLKVACIAGEVQLGRFFVGSGSPAAMP